MSEKIFIAQDELADMLERISKEMDVWVPVEMGDKKWGVRFLPYHRDNVVVLDRQSTISPKNVVFPQVETLLRFRYQKDDNDPSKQHIDLKDQQEVSSALVFGARSCDVRGFHTFDHVFLNGRYKDPYYGQRREKTLFATLLCDTEDSACFCSSVGSGPGDREGSDLWMVSVDDGYVIEALNDKGRKLIPIMGKQATPEQIEKAQQIQEQVTGKRIGEYDLTQSAKDFTGRFEDMDYWRDMISKCISCGICTFVCPTCYCFNITDESRDLEGERIRSWDSCMFYHYTLEASGHNPRPEKFKRYRNRVGHKFSYFPDTYNGMISCCGCGRCIRSCPVSIDIRRIVHYLKETADAEI